MMKKVSINIKTSTKTAKKSHKTKAMPYKLLGLPLCAFVVFLAVFSCQSLDKTEENVNSRSTSAIRLDDISGSIQENPITALNLIYIYKEVYSVTENSENEDWALLAQYEKEAIEKLCAMQNTAIEEERWDDAVSLGRSIASIGVRTPNTGREAAFTLAGAKKKLSEGDNLSAFLSAVRAHEMQAIDSASALLFLERAVQVRQRRAAAFFYSAAQAGGSRNISASLREYATGRDTVSDMIKGVATVIVDRGFRVERGMGIPDRVLGSAFFIDASGLLITNYHVIASEVDPKYKGYSRMYVRMGDASSPRIPARVIGYDKALDLALIKTEIETEYVFSIVDRVIPQVGDTVLAIGSPVGLQKTVTSGIVSALGRRFLQIGDVIQIDASVNHGNSGGPVVDNEGRLVGIVFAGAEHFQGLNFAVPAESLAAALPAMIKGGKAQRPWLGFTLCETSVGAEIIYVAPNTPASRLQVDEGLTLRTINGRVVTAPQGGIIPALQKAVFSSGPGELLALETVDSEGATRKWVMMTVPRPEIPLLDAARIDRRERIAAPLFGMVLSPLHSNFFSSSFRVNKVVRGSIADEAGISEDDPVSISRLRLLENEGYALMDITVKKRRMGYLETSMQLPAWLDSPDTL
ncbi:MAG: S1C family serine protease [Treponema sp.]|jgi:S1-C subfamily serine protease|nr:S1C family serine protease [Treponema sp.]